MREHKHARLGEQISIHVLCFENRKDLAINHIKHPDPGVTRDRFQAILLDAGRKGVWVGGKPNFEQFLRAYAL